MISSSPKVFIDANVLIELLLDRPHAQSARHYLEAHAGKMGISALTAHLVVHFGLRVVDLLTLQSFLGDYRLLPLEATDFAWAFTHAQNTDFEDALQLAVALNNDYETFVTLDKQLHRTYAGKLNLKLELLH